MSTADELAKLDHLRKTGVLSDQEFEREKVKVLAGQPAPPVKSPVKSSTVWTARIGLLVVVAVIVVIVIAVTSGGGASKYHAHVVAAFAANTQEMTVDFTVTNAGSAAGTPTCTINAASPGDADTGIDAVTPVKPIKAGETGRFTDTFTITNNGANNVLLSGVTVSCS